MSINKNYSREQIDHIRKSVHCGLLLEKYGFKIDQKESSKRHLKYKNNGQTIIVTHEGKGWWNPHNTDRGDIFNLQKKLNEGMSFLEIVNNLELYSGLSPIFPEILQKKKDKPPISPKTIEEKKILEQHSECWDYLVKQRNIPSEILLMAIEQKVIRQGIKGTSLFLHKKINGEITGAEMRGPEYRGFFNGGTKTIFYFMGGRKPAARLVIVEAAIDALSFAALDPIMDGTLYVSTGGGMGPDTIQALKNVMQILNKRKNTIVEIGTDNDKAGNNYAEILVKLSEEFNLNTRRIVPVGNNKDWNDVLLSK